MLCAIVYHASCDGFNQWNKKLPQQLLKQQLDKGKPPIAKTSHHDRNLGECFRWGSKGHYAFEYTTKSLQYFENKEDNPDGAKSP